MRTHFSPNFGKFTDLHVRQKPSAGLQLRETTSPCFPILRTPRQQRIGKRTILTLGPQGLTCGRIVTEFCDSLGVGRTIREVENEPTHEAGLGEDVELAQVEAVLQSSAPPDDQQDISIAEMPIPKRRSWPRCRDRCHHGSTIPCWRAIGERWTAAPLIFWGSCKKICVNAE